MRKTILCVGKNEQVLSIRKFLLETRGYRVRMATAEIEVLLGSQRNEYTDAQLAIWDGEDFKPAAIARMQQAVAHARPMVLTNGDIGPIQFLEKVRLEIART